MAIPAPPTLPRSRIKRWAWRAPVLAPAKERRCSTGASSPMLRERPRTASFTLAEARRILAAEKAPFTPRSAAPVSLRAPAVAPESEAFASSSSIAETAACLATRRGKALSRNGAACCMAECIP